MPLLSRHVLRRIRVWWSSPSTAQRLSARAIVIATGAEYRKPPLPNLATFESAGIYYGATPMEAPLCAGEDIAIVGGGNSAGQAAVFLASKARRVQMMIRGDGLAKTMSRYLNRLWAWAVESSQGMAARRAYSCA